jgi:hypothetical protein
MLHKAKSNSDIEKILSLGELDEQTLTELAQFLEKYPSKLLAKNFSSFEEKLEFYNLLTSSFKLVE